MTDSAPRTAQLHLRDDQGNKLCGHCATPVLSGRMYYHPECAEIIRTRTEKPCAACGVVKPLDAYSRRVKALDGRRSKCRPCNSEQVQTYHDVNPDVPLNAHLLRKFGISLEEFRALEAAQGGRCAICRQPPVIVMGIRSRRQGRAVRPRLVVDHDHETGKIRGLLCTPCNRGIGFLDDSPERVAAALEYLRRT